MRPFTLSPKPAPEVPPAPLMVAMRDGPLAHPSVLEGKPYVVAKYVGNGYVHFVGTRLNDGCVAHSLVVGQYNLTWKERLHVAWGALREGCCRVVLTYGPDDAKQIAENLVKATTPRG